MHYRVRARFREETAGELRRVLRDGTIAAQRPDGPETVDSLGDRDVGRADDRGYTALHGAALRGANPIVEFLAERGADLLAESNEGWTPLRIADGVTTRRRGRGRSSPAS